MVLYYILARFFRRVSPWRVAVCSGLSWFSPIASVVEDGALIYPCSLYSPSFALARRGLFWSVLIFRSRMALSLFVLVFSSLFGLAVFAPVFADCVVS